MNERVSYLIRKLAIIMNDGQFQNYNLVYLSGIKVASFPEEHCLSDIAISAFDRERAGVSYVDSMTIKEMPDGVWKML